MAHREALSSAQIRALGRLTALRGFAHFYLAGGSAVAWHLGHRRSGDLDLFGDAGKTTRAFRDLALHPPSFARLLDTGDVTLRLLVGRVPVDVVRYPYPLLEPAVPGPAGSRVASPLDLSTMKLAAVARRGLARDFWDLHALAEAGISLDATCSAYRRKYALRGADLYHVLRALTWFEDADREARTLAGMTAARWRAIRSWYCREVPRLVERVL